MPEPLVTYALDGDVALLGLNRDDVRNASTAPSSTRSRKAYCARPKRPAPSSSSARARSTSPPASTLRRRSRGANEAPEGRPRRTRSKCHTIFELISRGEIPFVSALKGATVGGGLELAAATQIRVADETTFFALPEGQRGIFVGGGGSVNIQRLLGYARMADLMLTGRVLSAVEGERMNLCQYVVPAGQSFEKAKELARKIAMNAPLTNWAVCSVLPRVTDLSHDHGLAIESLIGESVRSAEGSARIGAFLEGRATPIVPPGTEGARPGA